jgi:hypothetical protein
VPIASRETRGFGVGNGDPGSELTRRMSSDIGVDFAFGAMVYREDRLGNKDSLGLVEFVGVSVLDTA